MADHADSHGHEDASDEDLRVTSPMQEFTTGQVGVGVAILVVGVLVTFGVPLALA